MTSSLSQPSLLPWHCSTFVEPRFKFKFKSPANWQRYSPPTVRCGARSLKASRLCSTGDVPGCNHVFVCGRRKAVILLSTTYFLFGLVPCAVKASELHMSVYSVMKEEIRKVVTKGKAAGVLRLVFHDAGTFQLDENSGGMNGSLVYELDRPENAGLRKSIKILEKAKIKVDAIHPVSWADMFTVAGAEAVSICGGPTIPVVLGRLDSTDPDPEGKLPQETLNALGLKECFKQKGFSTQELVALSGAHTIGSKGFGNPVVFDNSYYKVLLEKPWTSSSNMASMIGLPSDHALVEDDECLRWVKEYAQNQDMFFQDFRNAYLKLVNSGAKWKSL